MAKSLAYASHRSRHGPSPWRGADAQIGGVRRVRLQPAVRHERASRAVATIGEDELALEIGPPLNHRRVVVEVFVSVWNSRWAIL